MSRFGTRSPSPAGLRRPMPFRHKLMLLLALELVGIGFQQAERRPYRPGVAVEVPAQSGHVIT